MLSFWPILMKIKEIGQYISPFDIFSEEKQYLNFFFLPFAIVLLREKWYFARLQGKNKNVLFVMSHFLDFPRL